MTTGGLRPPGFFVREERNEMRGQYLLALSVLRPAGTGLRACPDSYPAKDNHGGQDNPEEGLFLQPRFLLYRTFSTPSPQGGFYPASPVGAGSAFPRNCGYRVLRGTGENRAREKRTFPSKGGGENEAGEFSEMASCGSRRREEALREWIQERHGNENNDISRKIR